MVKLLCSINACKQAINICALTLCLLITSPVKAQFGTLFTPKDSIERYVSVQVHLFPPYRLFFAEYADSRAGQFLVRLVLNDLSMCFEQVMVDITLEAMDIVWKRDTRVFSFSGRWMLELNGSDFVPFFASINTPQNTSKTGMFHLSPGTDPYRIPDGLYRIGFEISGFGAKMRPTKVYTPYYPFFLDDPPKLQLPKNKSIVTHSSTQNVRFEWKPRHTHSENIDPQVKVSYHLELFEAIPGKDLSAETPDWTYSTTASNYTLTANDYLLQPGRKYAWRIRITTDNPDETYFHDNGCSDINIFEYQ